MSDATTTRTLLVRLAANQVELRSTSRTTPPESNLAGKLTCAALASQLKRWLAAREGVGAAGLRPPTDAARHTCPAAIPARYIAAGLRHHVYMVRG